MNLIEQLGGYECAAYEYKNTLLADDFPYVIKATGTRFTRPELGDELLEHRRQHNIFEVGDWITSDYATYQILSIEYGDLYKVANNTYWEYGCFSHATDEEIKAGKRLEVNHG